MTTPLVTEYDPRWPGQFRTIAAALGPILDGQFLRIEHVRSTAVPGLVAKPIIDVVVVIEPDQLEGVIERLRSLGFQHEGDLGIPGREAFKPQPGTPAASLPRQHLYVCPQGTRSLQEQLAFRDFLRSHPAEAERLSEHKRDLCRRFDHDKGCYIRGKSDHVREIIRAAMPDGRCLAPQVD